MNEAWDDAVFVSRWLRHLGAELSCAQGLAVPLESLLLRWAGRIEPQHMFDGLRQLLEEGEAELELGPNGYLLAMAPEGKAAARYVTRGEFAVLASAIAAVQVRGEEIRRWTPNRVR
jgi:hypothetical protein